MEKEFGTKSDDGGQSDDTDISAGSLELSETQSQPFDPLEPVTQPEDVPAQLAAEKQRKIRKIQRAAEQRKKGEAEIAAETLSAAAGPDKSVVSAPKRPAKKKKSRLAVRKQKEVVVGTPQRSPRVHGTSVSSGGSKPDSPHVLASKKASHLPLKKAAPVSRLKKSFTAKDPAPAVKATASNAKKDTVKVKKSATGK